MNTPTLPAEFFSIAELQAIAGSPQRCRVIEWIKNNKVAHVIGLHGWPVIYRTHLLPQQPTEAQNASPANLFDYSAAHASRRSSSQR